MGTLQEAAERDRADEDERKRLDEEERQRQGNTFRDRCNKPPSLYHSFGDMLLDIRGML